MPFILVDTFPEIECFEAFVRHNLKMGAVLDRRNFWIDRLIVLDESIDVLKPIRKFNPKDVRSNTLLKKLPKDAHSFILEVCTKLGLLVWRRCLHDHRLNNRLLAWSDANLVDSLEPSSASLGRIAHSGRLLLT